MDIMQCDSYGYAAYAMKNARLQDTMNTWLADKGVTLKTRTVFTEDGNLVFWNVHTPVYYSTTENRWGFLSMTSDTPATSATALLALRTFIKEQCSMELYFIERMAALFFVHHQVDEDTYTMYKVQRTTHVVDDANGTRPSTYHDMQPSPAPVPMSYHDPNWYDTMLAS